LGEQDDLGGAGAADPSSSSAVDGLSVGPPEHDLGAGLPEQRGQAPRPARRPRPTARPGRSFITGSRSSAIWSRSA
jgi:hypothetical protein